MSATRGTMGGEQSAVVVTHHAMRRWAERVHQCSLTEARDEILAHAPVIRQAAAFGAPTVRLGSRHRLVLEGLTVVTVLPPTRFQWDRW